MAKILGCKIECDDEVEPVFKIDIDGAIKEICFFPDPPHMVKLIRNLLGNKALLKTSDDKLIINKIKNNLINGHLLRLCMICRNKKVFT